jgi:hypothetical protein
MSIPPYSLSDIFYNFSLSSEKEENPIPIQVTTRKRKRDEEEHNFEVPVESRPSRRQTLSFDTNATIARGGLLETEDCASEDEMTDRLIDHAQRRVYLFYYLLLSYYKQNVSVSKAPTILQHGKAELEDCHAAHSSILPNTTSSPRDIIEKESYLFHSLNSTVELHKEFNRYDCILEAYVRPRALEILEKTSLREQHPYELLKKFTTLLHFFFDQSLIQAQEKINLLNKLETQAKLMQLQAVALTKNHTPSKKECCLFLKALFKSHKNIKKINDFKNFSPKSSSDYLAYLNRFLYPFYNQLISLAKKEKEIFLAMEFKKAKKYLKSLNITESPEFPSNHYLLEALNSRTSKIFYQNLEEYWKHTHVIHFLQQLPQIDKQITNIALKAADSLKDLQEVDFSDTKEALEDFKDVAKAQAKGSLLPDYRLLSGFLQEGSLVGLTTQELIEQRDNILSTFFSHNS